MLPLLPTYCIFCLPTEAVFSMLTSQFSSKSLKPISDIHLKQNTWLELKTLQAPLIWGILHTISLARFDVRSSDRSSTHTSEGRVCVCLCVCECTLLFARRSALLWSCQVGGACLRGFGGHLETSYNSVVLIPLIVYRLHILDLCSYTVSLAWPGGCGYCGAFWSSGI